MARSITVNLSSPDIINMTGRWTFNKYLKVSYSWSNAPSGMKSTVPIDSNKYKPGDLVSVDNTMTATTAYKDESAKKYYKFSGWNKSGEFNISSDTNISGSWDNGTTITPGWTTKNPNISNNVNICYGDGYFVTVANSESGGNTTSKISLYSSDGKTWKTSSLPTARKWTAICYGNGKFVTFDFNSNYVACGTISNGTLTWTETTCGSTNPYVTMALCYGNGKFVGLSNGSSSVKFVYSTNGTSWTVNTIASGSFQAGCLCYGNGKFVGLGTNSNLYTSTDGTTWTVGSVSSVLSGAYGTITYGNGKFIGVPSATGTNYIYSTDGTSWTKGTLPSEGFHVVVFDSDNSLFIITDKQFNAYTSSDGINWTLIASRGSISTKITITYGAAGGGIAVYVGNNNYCCRLEHSFPSEYNYVS